MPKSKSQSHTKSKPSETKSYSSQPNSATPKTKASFQFDPNSPYSVNKNSLDADQQSQLQTFRSMFREDIRDAYKLMTADSPFKLANEFLVDYYFDIFTHKQRAVLFKTFHQNELIRFDEKSIVEQQIELLPLASKSTISSILGGTPIQSRHYLVSDDIVNWWVSILNHHLTAKGIEAVALEASMWPFISSKMYEIFAGSPILSYETLLMPINTGNHWIMAYISKSESSRISIDIYDSLSSKYTKVEQALRDWARNLLGAEDVRIHYASCPRQINLNCGMHMCLNMSYLAFGLSFDYTHEDTDSLKQWMIYYIHMHCSANSRFTPEHRNSFLADYRGSAGTSSSKSKSNKSDSLGNDEYHGLFSSYKRSRQSSSRKSKPKKDLALALDEYESDASSTKSDVSSTKSKRYYGPIHRFIDSGDDD